jgi:aminoglycoside phosphotransferase (APT) family kinase protein
MNAMKDALSDRTLQWVVNSVHKQADVVSIERLQGGISSLVHAITLSVGGKLRRVVLRQFDNREWVRREPDLALREAESLRRASAMAGVRAPAIVAFDGDGAGCGMPAVLMTRLEGRVVLEPKDVSCWLDGMALSLSRIHAEAAGDFPWSFAPYCDASTLDTSSWSSVPDKWRAAADIVTGHRPSFAKRFIHRDYHPANVLWNEGEVSGIVDWVNGCVGPAGIDVGHCRVNLAQLHGVGTADEFLDRYRRHAGDSFHYDPYWDLVTLIDFAYWPPEVYGGWTALGVAGLTAKMMGERLDAYLCSLLNRLA